jgi:UDP:flavonoid glycosyltransferase YjiC (YdhE family)
MRVLLTTRGSSGHLGPLVPFARACLAVGHEVLLAAQGRHRANVERAGLPFASLGDLRDEDWMPLLADYAQLDFEAANARMVGEFFGRLDTAATLPALRRLVADWAPDVIVRESWEYASVLVAELEGTPLARVGLGLGALEERSIGWAAPHLEPMRAELGLPPDPAGNRLRRLPYLTTVPAELEDPGMPLPPVLHRFGNRPPHTPEPLPDWWPGNHDPLVYLTFGSVTAGEHLPYFPSLYRAAIEALAPLAVRILVTVGEPRDLDDLGPLPANVHAERWVPQDAVAARAAAIVCHGGHGSTLGALARGVPLVVLPLFSVDQFINGAAVSRAGAGVALDDERSRGGPLEPPGEAVLARLAPAVGEVLAHPGYRERARSIAGAMGSLPPVDTAVAILAAIGAD